MATGVSAVLFTVNVDSRRRSSSASNVGRIDRRLRPLTDPPPARPLIVRSVVAHASLAPLVMNKLWMMKRHLSRLQRMPARRRLVLGRLRRGGTSSAPGPLVDRADHDCSESEIDVVQNPSRPSGIAARIVLSFFNARM